MNEVVKKILLAQGKFMPNMYLRQSGFAYSACGPFIKNKERIQKLKKNREFTIYLSKWTK